MRAVTKMRRLKFHLPFHFSLTCMTSKTLKQLYIPDCISIHIWDNCFWRLVAPVLELKLGLGGTSYEDFIRNIHLPMQLSQVDPIVASFSGGGGCNFSTDVA